MLLLFHQRKTGTAGMQLTKATLSVSKPDNVPAAEGTYTIIHWELSLTIDTYTRSILITVKNNLSTHKLHSKTTFKHQLVEQGLDYQD